MTYVLVRVGCVRCPCLQAEKEVATIIMFIDSKTVNIKQSYEYSICRSLICWENRFQPGED